MAARCRCGAQGSTGSVWLALLAGGALLGYVCGGALVLAALEGRALHRGAAPHNTALRARAVERLWAITEDLNILYRDNWTRLAEQELSHFQHQLHLTRSPSEPPASWSFANSFLYALTLVTTIGPGEDWSVSAVGRTAGALYAAVGIPLMLVYLAAAGGAGAGAVRRLWVRITRSPRAAPVPSHKCSPFQAALNLSALPPRPCPAVPRVPAAVAALLAVCYVLLGALLFRATEHWSLLDGFFFSFTCLATIGFGELRPGRYGSTVSPRAENIALAACCAYIFIGVAVVAICFDLMQEDMTAALRELAARSNVVARVGLGTAPDTEGAAINVDAQKPS